MDDQEEVDLDTQDLSKLGADLTKVEAGPPPPSPPPVTGPVGPRLDPVFPSLPADKTTAPPLEIDIAPSTAVAFPFIRNVFSMTPLPWGTSKAEFLSSALEQRTVVEGSPESLYQPERERVAAIAADFVNNHARRIERDFYIKTPHRSFAKGTIVVSEDNVPTSRLRHAKFQWAITNGKVVELQNVRLPVAHLGYVERTTHADFATQISGELHDLAYFLAVLLDIFNADAPEPLAAIGDIVHSMNTVATVTEIDPYLEGAKADHMHDLILPRGDGKVNALHDGVRYWSVRDTDEAAFSALAAMSGEVVVPNLVRRALTKQAYSWLSLAFTILVIMVFEFISPFGLERNPPVTFLRLMFAILGVFLMGSFVFTHRYWRMDR